MSRCPIRALAGLADAAASGGVGVGRSYARLSDDELIGVLGGVAEDRGVGGGGPVVGGGGADRPPPGRAEPGIPAPPMARPVGPNVIPGDVPGASGGAAAGEHAGGSGGRGASDGPASGGHAGGSGAPGASGGPDSGGPDSGGPDCGGNGGPGARTNPAAGDGAGGGARRDRIPAGWGKFCADELAVAMAVSRPAAERMLALAHDLAARLPRTAQALHEGVIDAYKAQIIAEATRVLDDAAAAAAEAAILAPVSTARRPARSAPRRAARSSPPTRPRRANAARRRRRTRGWSCGARMPGRRRCAGSGCRRMRRWPPTSGSGSGPRS